ncbi:MAG TPA: phytanoyl-CoA dioxygenase family protein [Tepidisphaeraceae bacterium]
MAGHQWTPQQLNDFNRDGYLFAPMLFNTEEMKLLIDIAKADKEMAEGGWVMKDAQGGESKLNLSSELRDDIYSAIVHSGRIVEPIRQILADEVYHWHHKMMLKEPFVGGAWEWHQDYGYWYGDNCLFPNMISCMIAVDRASKENGCLQVLRGSHLMGRINHGASGGQAGADMERVNAAVARLETVYCEMEPGTALFFHCNTLHRSDPNKSPNSRWSLICCYNAMNNIPFTGKGHGKPIPLETWADDTIVEVGTRHWKRLEPAAV